jgi:hypothetical protein
MIINPFCPRCGNAEEDSNNVFKDRTRAKKVWFHFWGVRFDDISLSFVPWLEQTISQSPLDVISYVLSLRYNIWFARE